MKHLVLHPTDLSTTFLEPIYKNLPDATVITGGKTQDQVFKEIEAHDHIVRFCLKPFSCLGRARVGRPKNCFNA